MPYLSTDQVKAKRKELKEAFPTLKLSVTKSNGTGINVDLIEGNIDFGTSYKQVNHYYIERSDFSSEAKEVLQGICDVVQRDNRTQYEDSDYGSIPQFYVHLSVGKWNRPYKKTA